MRQYFRTIAIAAAAALIGAGAVAWAARTNYLGTVFIADTTTPTQQLKVSSNGSLDVNVVSGGGTGGTSSNFDAAFPAEGTAIGISDGTNLKSVLAPVILSPTAGVNGNNMIPSVGYIYNGSGYIAAPGSVSYGATVSLAGQLSNNITTNTDTNVKASAGTFVGIVVNTGGTTSTAKVYNDADGTCSSGLIGTFATTAQVSLTVNAVMTTGICVTTAGAGAADITILYR